MTNVSSIEFEVDGWPPAKNEALSIFNPTHGQAPRVRMLLEAAQEALTRSEWQQRMEGRIGLELVVIQTRSGERLADATNSLGGVADVLQQRRPNTDLTHLGDLAKVALYADDGQVCEVQYSEELGGGPRYRVRLWML